MSFRCTVRGKGGFHQQLWMSFGWYTPSRWSSVGNIHEHLSPHSFCCDLQCWHRVVWFFFSRQIESALGQAVREIGLTACWTDEKTKTLEPDSINHDFTHLVQFILIFLLFFFHSFTKEPTNVILISWSTISAEQMTPESYRQTGLPVSFVAWCIQNPAANISAACSSATFFLI